MEETELEQVVYPPPTGSASNPGSSLAALWIRVTQDDQPPASIPSTLIPLETCPNCNQVLALPPKPSDYQTCVSCAWSNQPRLLKIHEPHPVQDDPLQQLLNQAASASLTKFSEDQSYSKLSLWMLALQTILNGIASTITNSSHG